MVLSFFQKTGVSVGSFLPKREQSIEFGINLVGDFLKILRTVFKVYVVTIDDYKMSFIALYPGFITIVEPSEIPI